MLPFWLIVSIIAITIALIVGRIVPAVGQANQAIFNGLATALRISAQCVGALWALLAFAPVVLLILALGMGWGPPHRSLNPNPPKAGYAAPAAHANPTRDRFQQQLVGALSKVSNHCPSPCHIKTIALTGPQFSGAPTKRSTPFLQIIKGRNGSTAIRVHGWPSTWGKAKLPTTIPADSPWGHILIDMIAQTRGMNPAFRINISLGVMDYDSGDINLCPQKLSQTNGGSFSPANWDLSTSPKAAVRGPEAAGISLPDGLYYHHAPGPGNHVDQLVLVFARHAPGQPGFGEPIGGLVHNGFAVYPCTAMNGFGQTDAQGALHCQK